MKGDKFRGVSVLTQVPREAEAVKAHCMRVMGSRLSPSWATPRELYMALDAEFGFTLDPCPLRDSSEAGMPLFGTDGLSIPWDGERVFCNPPYGPPIPRFLAKHTEADVAVYLVPARTDTRWFHDYAARADELRFIKGRLRFGDGRYPAPFPSLLMIFRRPHATPD